MVSSSSILGNTHVRSISAWLLAVWLPVAGLSQVGIGTTAPNPNSVLELTGVAQGFLPPRQDTTNLGTSGLWSVPEAGMLVVHTPTSELCLWDGSDWVVLGQSSTFTAGSGIGISGGVITNTTPDQVVSLTSGGDIGISGTYPNFTLTNTAPDQVVSLIGGTDIGVTGTYPNFTVDYTGVTPIAYTAGAGINLSGTDIINTAPDQIVALTNGGDIGITGSYPNFTLTNTAPGYWTQTGSNLAYTTGNVGIRTAAGGNALTINGNVRLFGNAARQLTVAYTSTGTPDASVEIINEGVGDAYTRFRASGDNFVVGLNNATNQFEITNDLTIGAAPDLAINLAGNVGIGGSATAAKLNVAGDVIATDNITSVSASAAGRVVGVANTGAGNANLTAQAISGGDAYTYTQTATGTYSAGVDNSDGGKYKLTNGLDPSTGTVLLTADAATTNIGIGTTAPAYTLTVDGTLALDSLATGGLPEMLTIDANGVVDRQPIPGPNPIFFQKTGNDLAPVFPGDQLVVGAATASANINRFEVISVLNGTEAIQFTNQNAGGNATARINTQTDGGGDAFATWTAGGTQWLAGVDNSENDRFTIAQSNSPGVNDQLVITTDGNVGIGTATPAYTLTLDGTLALDSLAPATTEMLVIQPTGEVDRQAIPAATPSPWTGSPDISYTGGNVGIGVVNPGTPFDVRGNTRIVDGLLEVQNSTLTQEIMIEARNTNAGQDVGISATNSVAGQDAYYLWQTAIAAQDAALFLDASNGNALSLAMGSVISAADRDVGRVMTITQAGNVGIGTTTPAYTLTVDGTLALDSLAPATTEMLVIQPTGVVDRQAIPAATPSPWTGSPNISYTGGNVGIGITTPTDRLEIVGVTGAESALRLTNYNAAPGSSTFITSQRARGTILSPTNVQSGDNIGTFLFSGYATNFTVAAEIRGSVDGTPSTGDMPGRLEFRTTPDGSAISQERMRIDNQGRVGIGTSVLEPTARLLIESPTNDQGIIIPRLTSLERDGIISPAVGLLIYNTDNDQLERWDGSWAPAVNTATVWTGSPDISYTGGFVGIGTTTPTRALEISDEGPDADILLNQADNLAAGPGILFHRSRGDFTTPSTVNNNDELGGFTFRGYNGSLQTAARIKVEVDGTPGASDVPTRIVFDTYASGGSGALERMRIDNQGNVGIGTTNPVRTLQVDGAIYQSQNTTGTALFEVENINTSVGAAARILVNNAGASDAYQTFELATGTDYSLGVDNDDADKFKISEGNSLGSLDRFTIASGGNVGIGTTNPAYTLTVDGTLALDSLAPATTEMLVIQPTGVVDRQAIPAATPSPWTGSPDISYTGGNVGIGTNTPQFPLEAITQMGVSNYNNTGGSAANIQIRRARNTVALPNAVQSNDLIGAFLFSGYDGSGFVRTATILNQVEGTPTAGNVASRLVFETRDAATGSLDERMRISNTGATITRGDLLLRGTASQTVQDAPESGGGFIGLMGPASQYSIGVQDGNGRIQHKWNASNGTGETFLVGGENAWFWDVAISGDPYLAFKYADGSSASAGDPIPWRTDMAISSGGNVGIGTPNPTQALSLVRESSGDAILDIENINNAGTNPSDLYFTKSRGTTEATRADVQADDHLGAIHFRGRVGATTEAAAWIIGEVDGTPGPGDMPGRLNFLTSPDGSGTPLERMRITNQGFVGIGTSAPERLLHMQGFDAAIISERFNNAASAGSGLLLRRARTSSGVPVVVQNGDNLGQLVAFGYDGSNYQEAASIVAQVDDAPGASDMPGLIRFNTTPDGGFTPIERMRIDNQGRVGIGTSAPENALSVVGSAAIGSLGFISAAAPANGLMVEGNVGIGEPIPTSKLQVEGATTGYLVNFRNFNLNAGRNGLLVETANVTSTAAIAEFTNSSGIPALYVRSDRNVGLSTSTPVRTLDVNGNARVQLSAATVGQPQLEVEALSSGSAIDIDNLAPSGIQSVADRWQSFTPTVSGELRSIEVKLFTSTTTGTLTIYAGEGTAGTVLATQAYSFNVSGLANRTVTFATPPFLAAGQIYTMRFSSIQWTVTTSGNPYAGGRADQGANADYAFRTFMATAGSGFYVGRNGRVGIGTSAPAENLDVLGNILASGSITPSDSTLKRDIQPIVSALDRLEQLGGYTYFWRPGNRYSADTARQLGVIAQEIQAVFPEAVQEVGEGDAAHLTVDYPKLVPVLIEALKQAYAEQNALNERVEALSSTVSALREATTEAQHTDAVDRQQVLELLKRLEALEAAANLPEQTVSAEE